MTMRVLLTILLCCGGVVMVCHLLEDDYPRQIPYIGGIAFLVGALAMFICLLVALWS